MKKLIIGAANFGNQYGLLGSNHSAAQEKIFEILNYSLRQGFNAFDTAPNYGESEAILGNFSDAELKISTKVTLHQKNLNEIQDSIDRSMRILEKHQVETVFIHDWYKASENEKTSFSMYAKKYSFRIGVSVYETNEIDLELLHLCEVKVIQVPLNILDQRFISYIPRLKELGIEVWARSIFLQGALTEDKNNRFMNDKRFSLIRDYGKSIGMSISRMATLFALQSQVDGIVLGVRSIQDIENFQENSKVNAVALNLADFASQDLNLIDPRKWSI